MKTDPSTLPQFDGRPVPWIVRWSGEAVNQPYALRVDRSGLRVVYSDGNEDREDSGILWQREGIRRGGEPEWTNVSTYRQRKAMRRRLCQVCGEQVPPGVIRWLVDASDGLQRLDDQVLTISAPTCEGCVDLALDMCPHLRKYGYQILKVLDYRVWGVYGEVVVPHEGRPLRTVAYVQYDYDYGPGFSYAGVLAKQQVVELGKYVVETIEEGTG